MTSRKQKIKSKREQEEKEIRQVRMAVAVVASLVVVGIIAYIVVQSGLLEPPPKEFVPYPETSGTPTQICNQHTPVEGSGRNDQFSAQPEMILEEGTDYRAIFCTTQGAIYLDLFEDRTPLTVNNMVFLASEGFYNNLIFHRVIEGFMAQGGDPTGTGTGGPGYRFQDEFVQGLTFDRPLSPGNGKCRTGHKWQPVLHHIRSRHRMVQ